ncbi:hypothetical protein ACP70R_000477 [Stipagrostis hirtigluma subsp. patula]
MAVLLLLLLATDRRDADSTTNEPPWKYSSTGSLAPRAYGERVGQYSRTREPRGLVDDDDVSGGNPGRASRDGGTTRVPMSY